MDGYDPATVPATDAETMEALRADTPLNRARRLLSSEAARIEQASAQRKPPSPIEMRRMEFEGVARIVAALGLDMPSA
jgi:hypothetical protein